MWIVIPRRERPVMPYWPGRRLLGAMDALAWPALWMVTLMRVDLPMGGVRPFLLTVLTWFAVSRCWRATFDNSDYTFTTWRWGKVLGGLLLHSWILQITSRHT
ncbi:hypothetical protein ACWA7J_02140 [Leptothrix sp. BB-4]